MAKSSRQVIQALLSDGWFEVKRHSGTSHRHFKHPTKPGKVTVPDPKKDLSTKTLKSIEKQSGLILS